ncbi:MAG TPA: hypothetical protein VJV04_12955, partial [Nitrospiraceae bacterium]|nr:hypothetical protein [Nitrospiraceae bacterium]
LLSYDIHYLTHQVSGSGARSPATFGSRAVREAHGATKKSHTFVRTGEMVSRQCLGMPSRSHLQL